MKGVLIGAGYFAQFQADGWNRIPWVKIAAVADTDVARASDFAGKWNIPAVYSSAEEALTREQPDFVDIVTRPEAHLELTELAAAHGVAVICQKPMSSTPAECRQMVNVCKSAGVRLIIHENWRWQPWYRESRRLIDSGAIGAPFHIGFVHRTGDGRGPEPFQVQPYFRTMKRLLIYETLVHHLDTIRYLGGEIDELYCQTRRLNPIIVGEDCALICAKLRGGASSLIDAQRFSGSIPAEVAMGTMRLEGEEGMLRLEANGDLFLTRYGKPEQQVKFENPSTGYKGDSILALQQHIVDSLMSGKPAESEGEDYLHTVAAVEACYESASTGQPIRMEPRA